MTRLEVRRIIVALDDSGSSRVALESAAALAARLDADLEALFVQDRELLQFAQLPLAHEVGLASASRRVLDGPGLERAWRAQSVRLRSVLQLVAERHRIRSSFRVTRGEVIAELIRAAADADMLAMGTMGQMSVTGRRLGSTVRSVTADATCSVLLLREGTGGEDIVVRYDGSEAGDRALSLARHLAPAETGTLIIALPEDAGDGLRHRLEEQLEPARRVRMEQVADAGLAELAAGAGLLVLPHGSPLLIDGDGDALLERLEAPVLVAR